MTQDDLVLNQSDLYSQTEEESAKATLVDWTDRWTIPSIGKVGGPEMSKTLMFDPGSEEARQETG